MNIGWKKKRSLFCIWVSLALVVLVSLPSLAQSRRRPTEAELETLKKNFYQELPRISEQRIFALDSRSESELQELEMQVSSWSRFVPELAPFLGEWVGWEEYLTIYPSIFQDRVCALFSGTGIGRSPENSLGTYFDFALLDIENGQLRSSYSILFREEFKEKKLLVTAFIYNERPTTSYYLHPRPLKHPTQLALWDTISEDSQNQILEEFNAAGCTIELPQ